MAKIVADSDAIGIEMPAVEVVPYLDRVYGRAFGGSDWGIRPVEGGVQVVVFGCPCTRFAASPEEVVTIVKAYAPWAIDTKTERWLASLGGAKWAEEVA